VTVHTSVTCDGCQTKDITGVRYKCSVCDNFDFCENCEATKDHPHPFLKIKTLKQTPIKIFTIINEEGAENPSFSVNGERVNAPPGFDGLIDHGIEFVRGFFTQQGKQDMRNKFHQMRN